jgi:hypothetical protein
MTADDYLGKAERALAAARLFGDALPDYLPPRGQTDLTSGFRCYNLAACEVLAAEEASLLDYQDIGVLLLRHAGLAITEVPVEMYPRSSGPSRIFASWPRVARYMIESTLLGVYPRSDEAY